LEGAVLMAYLDYGAALRAGQSLVPDMRAQLLQREAQDFQREQMDWAREDRAARERALLQETREQEAFREELERVLLTGTPQDILRLMARYPKMGESLKPLWESMDERQRTADLTQIGTIYARGQAGDLAGAAAALRQRVDADRAAGVPDPADEAVLAGLESNNPVEQRAALATIGIQLAAITGDKFAETYGKLNPAESKTAVQREYDWRVQQFGKESADLWLATQDESLIAVEPGGSVYRKSDFVGGGAPAQQRGGDPASTAVPATGSAIEQAALSAVPGAVVTSRQRSPARNRAVGGVANSFHLTDQARDFIPPQGMSMVQLATRLKQAMPGFDVINEGDHVHVEPSSRSAGPVRVRTKQEYDKLAPGTPYIAPDGSQRVKS
jgi:hypothetical protein